MKKSILFSKAIGILTLSLFLFQGCLKEGELLDDPYLNQLVVVPSSNNIEIGDTVNFDVVYQGEIVEADLYIDSLKISGTQYVFTEGGSYTVVAKNTKYKDSKPVTIVVASPQGSIVYVVGFENEDGAEMAKLWTVDSSNKTTLGVGMATDILYYNSQLHITGYDDTYGNNKALYWEDSTESVLATSTYNAVANSLYIEDGNNTIIIGGSVDIEGIYWENKTQKVLGSDFSREYVVNDAILLNGDIAAVGTYIDMEVPYAVIWAYEDEWAISNEDHSHANAIALQGNDYYIVGSAGSSYDEKAVYWNDNEGEVRLSTPLGLSSAANDIKIHDNNIYIVGDFNDNFERWNALLWINGDMIQLNDNDYEAGANAITVDANGHIYVAGWIKKLSDIDQVAAYWELDNSGTILNLVKLSSNRGEALGITLGID